METKRPSGIDGNGSIPSEHVTLTREYQVHAREAIARGDTARANLIYQATKRLTPGMQAGLENGSITGITVEMSAQPILAEEPMPTTQSVAGEIAA